MIAWLGRHAPPSGWPSLVLSWAGVVAFVCAVALLWAGTHSGPPGSCDDPAGGCFYLTGQDIDPRVYFGFVLLVAAPILSAVGWRKGELSDSDGSELWAINGAWVGKAGCILMGLVILAAAAAFATLFWAFGQGLRNAVL